MKTAISVDDALMKEADETARDLGLSRSGLIAEALRAYLKEQRGLKITAQLNEVYADDQTPEEADFVRQLRTKMPALDPW